MRGRRGKAESDIQLLGSEHRWGAESRVVVRKRIAELLLRTTGGVVIV